MNAERVELFGYEVDAVDLGGAVQRCVEMVETRARGRHVSLNAAKVVAGRSDARLREIVATSDLVTADGQPLVWAARLLGRPLPVRVAGIDLMESLLPVAAERGFGVYILGARAETRAVAVEKLRARLPQLKIVGTRDGYFTREQEPAVREAIRSAAPDILFVAMGSPQKEYWIADNQQSVGVPFAMGVGGAVDVLAGQTRRAPAWMQRAGLEWLYRLGQEPGRLWRRYLVTNSAFLALLLREVVRARIRGR